MASSNQIELDISYNLKNKGFRLIKDGQTVLLEDGEGNQARSYIYKEWNKTVKKFEDEIEKMQIVKDKLIFQEILACLTKNYNKIYSDNDNGSTSSIIASDSINDSTLEPETPLDKLNDITPEYWRTQLIAKYDVLQETIKTSITPLPQLKLSLEFALSVKNVLNIHDNTLPFAGFLLGAPSSLKTVTVELFRAYWHAKYTDDFSPKAFVSHYSGLPKEKLAEIDLLPKIRFKFFLTPELAPLFTGNEDEIKKAFRECVLAVYTSNHNDNQDAIEDAQKNIERSLNVLRFYLSRTMMPTDPIFHNMFMAMEGLAYTGLTVALGVKPDGSAHTRYARTGYIRPYEITEEIMRKMEGLHLDKLNKILMKPEERRRTFEKNILTSIDFYGSGMNEYSYKNRFVNFIISLETLLLVEREAREALAKRTARTLGPNSEARRAR